MYPGEGEFGLWWSNVSPLAMVGKYKLVPRFFFPFSFVHGQGTDPWDGEQLRGYRLNGSRDLKIVANPRVEWVITYLAFCEVFFLGGV